MFQFALKRDAAFEAEQAKHYKGGLKAFYDENRGGLSSGDQLLQGAVVIVGMEPFTTKGGLVRQLAVGSCVNFVE